jgi:3-hydroxyisobutyrate dehydrogenase-like beta-hydroxyacid dehydrogenase
MLQQEDLRSNEESGEGTEREVGIVGLGRMGRVFTNLLIAGGVHVTAYDIDADKVKAASQDGAIPASAIHDFSRCEVVLTSLPDDDAIRSVVLSGSGLASVLRPGTIHLSTSTIGVAFCRELDAAHRERGQMLVAMPVLGNPDLAAQRGLFILLGGPQRRDSALQRPDRATRSTKFPRSGRAMACKCDETCGQYADGGDSAIDGRSVCLP